MTNKNKVYCTSKNDLKCINRANKTELKVICYVFANGGSAEVSAICDTISESEAAVLAAIAFWRGAGLLADEPEEKPAEKTKKQEQRNEDGEKKSSSDKKFSSAKSDYTLSEIALARKSNEQFGALVSYMEKLTGKLYNAAEQGIVLYLYDTLGIDSEVIMGVTQYCVSKGKSSVRYIEKTVMNITDEGVKTFAELEAYFGAEKKADEYRENIKRITGIERAFTKPELSHIDRWEKEYGYSYELVEYAYEKTVAKINKPQITYMSRILEGWHEKGLKTPSEVDEYFKTSASKKEQTDGLDFDMDDIFERPH